jgi:polar amino acid transport system substrate-binding protein
MAAFARAALAALFLMVAAVMASAQTAAPGEGELVVATRVIPPFVIKRAESYSGFSVDLWTALTREMGVTSRFVEKATVADILESVRSGEATVAIAAISITAAREQAFDFSQPMMEAGLQVLVRTEAAGFGPGQVQEILGSGPMPWLLALLAGLIVIPAHMAWLAERRHPTSLFSPHYLPGIFEAMWWATGAAAGQQPDHPRSGAGRVISTIAILVSVAFLAYFTAALTSAMTVQQLKGDINGPEDLPGRKVATITGSTSAQWLASSGAGVIAMPAIADAFRALEDRRADAVVFDAPVLMYHAANAGKGQVRVVGQVFRKENYGIMFPPGNPLRKRVNAALLKLREDGTYDAIYSRWFQQASAAGS